VFFVVKSLSMRRNELQHCPVENLGLVVGRGVAGVAHDEQLRAGDGPVQRFFGGEGHGGVALADDDEGWAMHGRELRPVVKRQRRVMFTVSRRP